MGFIQRANNAAKAAWETFWGDTYESRTWNGIPAPGVTQSLAQIDELLFELNRGAIGYRGLDTSTEVRKAFRDCSPLETIIYNKGLAFVKGEVRVWDPTDKKNTKKRVYKPWQDLFLRPNEKQSGREFLMQGYQYAQKFGFAIIDPIYPANYNDRPYAMRVLPNWMVEWEFRAGIYASGPTAAYFNHDGVREQLDVSRLIIVPDSASTEIDESTGFPLPRISVLWAEIANFIAALEARGELIKDRGAMGALVNKNKLNNGGPLPMTEEETRRLQGTLSRRNGGIRKGQNKVIVMEGDHDFLPMSFNVDELGLHPEHIADLKTICGRFGYPFNMLPEGYESKYNNSTQSRRDFHDTTIDPESMDFMEKLSRGLGMYKEGCEAYIDYSGVAALQLSQQEKGKGAQAMADAVQKQWDAGLITRNDGREQMGLERIQGKPEFDQYKWELTDEQANETEEADNGGNQGSDQG